jgi:RNA 2',3'-cyclic 3'-phosphodiesterase
VRLFVAIAIPDVVRETIAGFLKDMRAIAPQTKWVRPDNLHVTLKFLGETDPQRLNDIISALRSVRSPQPVSLEFRGLGFFPNEKRPRVLWIGMDSSSNLKTLAQDIDQAVHRLGFSLENKTFTPHLTLARFNTPGLPPSLAAAVKQYSSRNFGSLVAKEFHLIESKLKPNGAEYTTLQSFPFVTEP